MSLRTALVGCGNIGGKRAAAVAKHPDTELVLAVDTDGSRAEALARMYGCRHATAPEAVLDADVDAVIVSVPTRWLASAAIPLLRAGRHVLCEKPLGRSLDEARAIAAAAREGDAALEVGFNLRFDAGLQEAHRLVAEGGVGELYFLRADYVNGAARTNTNGVGSLLDIGIHSLDLLLWFLGDVDRVYGDLHAHEGAEDDNGFAVLRRGDVRAAVHFSFVRWRNLFRFEASGSRGYVLVESLPKWGVQTLTHGVRVLPSGAPREERREFSTDLSWEREWAHFVEGARARRSDGENKGVRSMILADLVREAARTGTAVAWPEAVTA